MPTPTKPKKMPQNRPMEFRETLAPTAPALPSLPTVAPAVGVTDRQFRYLLVAIWVLAAVLAGVGIGRLMLANTQTATAPGLPLAQSEVTVVSSADTTTIAITPAEANLPRLVVRPATATEQAQAGTPFRTVGTSWFQTTGPDLQPGFTFYGRVQGNIGTDPVN